MVAAYSKGQPEGDKRGRPRRAQLGNNGPARDAASTQLALAGPFMSFSALQRLAGNRAVNRHLADLESEHRTEAPSAVGESVAQMHPVADALQRAVTMKDVKQDSERTDGSELELTNEVNATIDGDDYKDLNLTVKQMQRSISSRELLAVKNAKSWTAEKKETEAYRLSLERGFLEQLLTARDNHAEHAVFLAAQDAKKAAAAEKKKKNKGWEVVGKK